MPTSAGSATVKDTQTDCRFFNLPRGFHDTIYVFVLNDGIIHLQNVHILAPQPTLTPTCQRIHEEATTLSQITYAAYWAKNEFAYVQLFKYAQSVLTT